MDEARLHKELLHLFVSEGEEVAIPLSATGTGQVVTCPAIAGGIDFGHQFTGLLSWKDAALCTMGWPCAAASLAPQRCCHWGCLALTHCCPVTLICCLTPLQHCTAAQKCCHAVSICLHCLQQVNLLSPCELQASPCPG